MRIKIFNILDGGEDAANVYLKHSVEHETENVEVSISGNYILIVVEKVGVSL